MLLSNKRSLFFTSILLLVLLVSPHLVVVCASSPLPLPCYVQCTEWLDTPPHTVRIGVYLTSITELSPAANTYFAAGYYWLSWPSCATIAGQPLSPWNTVHLENVAQDWTYTRSAETSCSADRFPSPPVLPPSPSPSLLNLSADEGDGVCPRCNTPSPLHSYVSFRFSAMLSTAFFYTRYPVDTQSLELSFEDSYYNASYITLQLDEAQSGLHERVEIPGFSIAQVNAVESVATYNTQYGTSTTGSSSAPPPTLFSTVQLRVSVSRKLIFFLMKVLPPTLIVLATSVVMLSLDPTRLDARLGLSSSALLAEIFLANGFESGVPDTGVMSVDDWLFDWCYVVILAILVECVAVHRWLARIDELQFDEALRSSIAGTQSARSDAGGGRADKRQQRGGSGSSSGSDGVEMSDSSWSRMADEADEDADADGGQFHPARRTADTSGQRRRRVRRQRGDKRRSDEEDEEEIAREAMLVFVRQRRKYGKWIDEQFAWCAIAASSLGSLIVILIAAYA